MLWWIIAFTSILVFSTSDLASLSSLVTLAKKLDIAFLGFSLNFVVLKGESEFGFSSCSTFPFSDSSSSESWINWATAIAVLSSFVNNLFLFWGFSSSSFKSTASSFFLLFLFLGYFSSTSSSLLFFGKTFTSPAPPTSQFELCP